MSFNNIGKARQLFVHDGMGLKRNISLSDVDGFCAFKCGCFVYVEWKYGHASMSTPQRQGYEAAVKSHWKAGHPSILIFSRHNTPYNQDVYSSGTTTTIIYCEKKLPGFEFWGKTKYQTTLTPMLIQDCINLFDSHFGCP